MYLNFECNDLGGYARFDAIAEPAFHIFLSTYQLQKVQK